MHPNNNNNNDDDDDDDDDNNNNNNNNNFLPTLCTNYSFFNTFITFSYMFRTLLCSSSGGQIVLVQHLVSSLSLGDCSVHSLRKDLIRLLNSHLKRVTIPDAVLIQFDLLRMSTIVFETCRRM